LVVKNIVYLSVHGMNNIKSSLDFCFIMHLACGCDSTTLPDPTMTL